MTHDDLPLLKTLAPDAELETSEAEPHKPAQPPTNRPRIWRHPDLLAPWEIPWSDRQPFLESRGYMLRPRYHPSWAPSWGSGSCPIPNPEDAWVWYERMSDCLDASRISDGRPVFIKQVQTGCAEIEMVSRFSSDDLRASPDNHCVPILDHFQDDRDLTKSYLVMPYLHSMSGFGFDVVSDVVDLVGQLLEGLAFMHTHGVAHCDIKAQNVLVDARSLYSQGFHPMNNERLLDGSTDAWRKDRAFMNLEAYYINFKQSILVSPLTKPHAGSAVTTLDWSAPHHESSELFRADVAALGNLFRLNFCRYFNVAHFLDPLVVAMTHEDPLAQLTAGEALERWKIIRARISLWALAWTPYHEPLDWLDMFVLLMREVQIASIQLRVLTASLCRGVSHLLPEITAVAVATSLCYFGIVKPISDVISLSALFGPQCPWWAQFAVTILGSTLIILMLHLARCSDCRTAACAHGRLDENRR